MTVGLDAQTAAWVGRDGRLHLHTNLDAARGQLAVAGPSDPGVAHWRELLAEDPETVLEGVAFTDAGSAPDAEPELLLAS